jgi:branched-chain amino acid transport system permease protein
MIFAIACGFVGFQGSLLAHFITFVAPGSYTFNESLNLLVMNVIGGMGGLAGPLIGAAFLTALPEFLRGWVELQRVLYGIVLIVLVCSCRADELGRRLMIGAARDGGRHSAVLEVRECPRLARSRPSSGGLRGGPRSWRHRAE